MNEWLRFFLFFFHKWQRIYAALSNVSKSRSVAKSSAAVSAKSPLAKEVFSTGKQDK